MKTKTPWYIKTILSSAALLIAPMALAEEQAEPEIAICEGFVDTEIVINDVEDGEIVETEVIEDGEIIEDEEVVVDEKETTDSDLEEEVITIDWSVDWVKRGDENPEIFYMSANGGAPVENAANNSEEMQLAQKHPTICLNGSWLGRNAAHVRYSRFFSCLVHNRLLVDGLISHLF